MIDIVTTGSRYRKHRLPCVYVTVGAAKFRVVLDGSNIWWSFCYGNKKLWEQEKLKGKSFKADVSPKLEAAVYELLQFASEEKYVDEMSFRESVANFEKTLKKRYVRPHVIKAKLNQYMVDTLPAFTRKFPKKITLLGYTRKSIEMYQSWVNCPTSFEPTECVYGRYTGIEFVKTA